MPARTTPAHPPGVMSDWLRFGFVVVGVLPSEAKPSGTASTGCESDTRRLRIADPVKPVAAQGVCLRACPWSLSGRAERSETGTEPCVVVAVDRPSGPPSRQPGDDAGRSHGRPGAVSGGRGSVAGRLRGHGGEREVSLSLVPSDKFAPNIPNLGTALLRASVQATLGHFITASSRNVLRFAMNPGVKSFGS